ncbi:HtaA domain-containing protein [Arthrobacter sp. AQ5-05]|uniref:HtaA domain-containing protein n=1 Tax=Arthrobacter sp. AQ5-05 TaxID=2184581 RepID=UPI0012B5723B|nr:HtaA domain-containing protein [Arthrobacter sp. AQ5-05]
MPSTHRAPWWRRPMGVLATLAIAGSGLAAGATGAQANEATPASPTTSAVELTGGQLDWGVSKFFRDYITGNIAKGAITPAGGASANPDGTLRFPAVALDSAGRTLAFGGSVAFTGHHGALSTNISDIRIDLAQGMLLADVESISMSTGLLEKYDDVKFATVDTAGVQETGTAFVGTALPSAIHADGVPAFSNVFNAGAAFDPVTFNVTYKTVVQAPVVGVSPAAVSAVPGETATFTAAATGHDSVQWQLSAAGTGPWTDIAGATGEQLVVVADPALNGNLYRAAFSNPGGVVYSDPAALTVGDAPKVWRPALSVFAADGLTPLTAAVPEGTKVLVRGSGYDPAANVAASGSRPPISAGNPAGLYVVFGKFADEWKPSSGAQPSARVVGNQKWAMSQAAFDLIVPAYQSSVKGQWVEVAADGSFAAELTVQKKVVSGEPVEWPGVGNFGAYTYAAGGTVNATQELYAPITVGDAPVVSTATLSVTPADGLKHGSTLRVSGSGYVPGRVIYVAEVAQGPGGNARPALHERAQRVEVRADGTFGPLEVSVTTVFENGEFTAVKDQLFIATFNSPLLGDNTDHDYSNDRSQDAFQALAWADPSAPVVDPTPEVPVPAINTEAKAVEAGQPITFTGSNFTPGGVLAFTEGENVLAVSGPASPATGGLDWGVKESFRSYLAGPIANGNIAASDGATANPDGTFHFPAASYDATGKIAGFKGTFTMAGHEGALHITISKLTVDVKNKTLRADVTSTSADGTAQSLRHVVVATLDTASATSDAEGVKAAGLPVVLTEAGVPAFANVYEAGVALDPLSFDVSALAPANDVTVAADGTFSATWAVPARQKPGTYTVKATATPSAARRGIQALAVVEEFALLTFEIFAPADTKPVVPLTPLEPSTPNPGKDQCTAGTIVNGTLSWGVKESFRKYITGNIAKGHVGFNGKAATANDVFAFTGGKGTIDTAKRSGTVQFAGEVAFQGHDYGSGPVLSVTFNNITLAMEGNTGTLSADVLSRSLESATAGFKPGEETEYKGAVLATLDLGRAALNRESTVYAATGVPAVLAPSGVAPFADFYAAGDALDPVTFALGCNTTVELSGDAVAPPAAGTATLANPVLAKTGAMGLDATVLGALLVLLLGAGAMAGNRLVRRRT